MAWFGAVGGVLLIAAALFAVGAVGIFRADDSGGAQGPGSLAAIVGLAIGATLLGLMGLALLMTANSDSFGR